jgi:hypothetical protein
MHRVHGYKPVAACGAARSVTILLDDGESDESPDPLEAVPVSPSTRGARTQHPAGRRSGDLFGIGTCKLRLAGADAAVPGSVDWVVEAPQPEAVIFIHGFNSPVADALKRVAQLWTLGRFPHTLHPYIFGWPGAKDVTYFSAKSASRRPGPTHGIAMVAALPSARESCCRRLERRAPPTPAAAGFLAGSSALVAAASLAGASAPLLRPPHSLARAHRCFPSRARG